jgi:hypothetical protein
MGSAQIGRAARAAAFQGSSSSCMSGSLRRIGCHVIRETALQCFLALPLPRTALGARPLENPPDYDRHDLPALPQRSDDRCEQQSAKPVEKLSEDNKRMKINVNRGPEKNGQGEHTPARKGESNSAAYP